MFSRWGEEENCAPGNLCIPHMICVDPPGDIETCELNLLAVNEGLVPPD